LAQVLRKRNRTASFIMSDKAPAQATMGENKPPPSIVCKLCCPPCAVYSHQGFGGPVVAACCCGWCFTLFCWKPEEKKK